MASIEELKRRAYVQNNSKKEEEKKEDEDFSARIQELKARAKSTINIGTKLTGYDVDEWYKSAMSVGERAHSYLSYDGYKQPNSDYLSEIDKYLSNADDVAHYLRVNQSSYADFDSAIKSHYEVVNYLRSLKSGINSSNKFYSGFKDSEDYDFWDARSTVEKRQALYQEQQNKINDLNNFLDNYYTIDLWYQDYQERPWDHTGEDVDEKLALYEKHKAYKQKYGSAEDVKNEIAAIEAEMRNYERGNYNENGRFYGSKADDDHYHVTQNSDFGVKSANRNYTNPTKEDFDQFDVYNDSSTWYTDADGVYRDAYGNELTVDESGNWVNPKTQGFQVNDKLGLYLNATDQDKQEAAGNTQGMEGTWASIIKDGMDGNWEYLEEDEVGIYYYYLSESQEKANAYLDDMKTELNRRATLDSIGMWHKGYDEASVLEKIAMNAATLPAKFVSNVAGSIENAANTLTGKEINPYSAAQGGMHFSQTVRGDTAEELDKTGFKIPVIDFTLGDIYQTGMSRLDSTLATTVFGGGGTVFLGMGAAQEEAYKLYQQGASAEQITLGSFAAGAAEAVFEYASFGKLAEIKDVDTLGKWVKSILVQGWNEATEEALTEVSNIVTNALIMGSQSDLAELYRENKENAWNTFLDLTKQTAQAAFGGFIGGFGAGGAQAGGDYVNTTSQYRDAGRTVMQADGGVDALKNLANEVAGVSADKMKANLTKQADNVSSEVATGKNIVGKAVAAVKNASNATKVGRLYNTVQNANNLANASANQADIAKSLERKGFNTETANDIAGALVASYNGQELTKAQEKLLKSAKDSKVVQDAISNIMTNEQSTMGQRSQNIRDFQEDIKLGTISKAFGISKDTLKEMSKGNLSTEEKNLSEGNYEVSEEGKTVLDGKEVELDGLRKMEDGSVMAATTDGLTADAGEVTYPSKGHALVYENYANIESTTDNPVIANMDVADRSALAKAFDGGDGKVYFLGSNQAFWYGFEDITMDEKTLPANSLVRSITEEQRAFAYELGRKAGEKAAKTQGAGMKAAYEAAVEKLGGKEAAKAVAKKNEGKVVLEDNIREASMSKKQKASYQVADIVAKAVSTTIHVYHGVKEYGKYDPATGEIWLNINGNFKGSSMMAFTLAHELVHMAKQWNPAEFKSFADYLLEQYGKKGVSVESLIRAQMANAKANEYTLNEHEAYEEVIADACQRMLLDSDALQKMAGYKEQNPGKWQQIVDAIKKFVNNIRKLFKGAEPDSVETALYKELDDFVKNELEKKFVSMVMNASEHMNTIQNAFGKNTVVEVNADGEFTLAKGEVGGAMKFLYNDYTWEKGGRDTLEAALKAEGFSNEDIKAALTIMDGKHKLVEDLAKQFPEQARINQATITTDLKDGHSVLSALVSNGDYPVNIDLLMVCKKRKAYQRVINRLCETGMIQQATVDALAIAEINKILGKYGFETACLGCFVESRRLRIQEWANTIVKEWNAEVKKRNPNAKAFGFGKGEATLTQDEVMQLVGELESGGEKNDQGNLNLGQGSAVKRMGVLLDKVPSLRKTLSVEDLITPDGLTALRKYDSNLFSMVKSRYGSNSPKFVQEFNPYNHELAVYGKVPSEYKNLREYLYAIGGARMQSFSDFLVENWFDYCQIVADLAARKLPMHTYTKEIALAKLFGMTGIKINMSLIPDIDRSLGKEFAGLTRNADGELELIWADKDRFKATGGKSYMQSINFADAIALQNDPRYSGNVGTIAVGVSDKHILMMLDDARIRMIIPYHSSGMNPIFADLMGTSYYKDYTLFQNTTVKQLYNSKGQPVSLKLDKTQTGKITSGFQFNAVLQELGDARAAAEAYKEWCADASKHTITIKGETYTAELTPKFDDFSSHENYYKLLEDFNTYDCISEEAARQGDVQQVYPEGFDQILKDELTVQENHRQKQEENQSFDKAMGEIESYLSEHTKADTVFYAEQHGVKLSAKDKKLGADDKKKLADLRKGEKYSMPKVDSDGYQLSKAVEQKKDLLAFHNITLQLLQEALKRNGLLMPSLAITNKGMTDFGEISLLFDKRTIDPGENSENKLYGADAWTPTQTRLKKNAKFDTDKTVRTVNTMKNYIGMKYVSELLNINAKQFKDTITKADGSIYDAYAHNIGVQTAYAKEHGIISKIPTKQNGAVDKAALREMLNKELDTDNGWRQYKKWLSNISDAIITSYDAASNEEILNNMKAQPASAKTFKLSENGELVVPAAEYGSIEDVRKNKGRLSENSAEAAKAVADEFLALAKDIGNNTKSVVNAINAAFADRYSTANIVKTFGRQGINISSKTASELQALYKKAVELPTQYFEAKPQREVGLEEIKAVVIPADAAYAEMKGKLKNLGITVVEYDGTNESRVKALNSVENLKFSMPKVSNEGYDTTHLVWAIESDIINENDQARFWEAIAEIRKLNYNGIARTKNGGFIIETKDKMMFTDADFKAPTLSKVICFTLDGGKDVDETRRMIRDEAQRTGRTDESVSFAEELYGSWFIAEYNARDYKTYAWQNRRGEGAYSRSASAESEGRGVRYGGENEVREGRGLKNKSPNSRGMSPRQLLADAFDELVQTPKEREKMDEYRSNITKVEGVQDRLTKLRGEISKQTKAKGDKAKIAEMNKRAKELAELIDKYDRKLLELEASKPLRDVLARARAAAYQEARQRSEESLKEYRQQVSERFDRGVEGRRKTEMRKKIRKVIRELDKILNRGNKKRNVKEDMKDFVAEALSAAEVLFTDNYTNEDIIRNGFGVELSKEEAKYLEEARGFMDELSNLPVGGYDSWQARQEAEEKIKSKLAYRMSKLKDAFFRERQRLNKAEVAEVLGNLADAYAKLETSEYAYVNGAYHGAVYQYLKMLQEDVGGAKIKDMTLGQLEELHKAYTMVLTTVQNANKMFAEDLKQSKEELANRVMMEVYQAGGEHGLWSKGELARNQASWNNTKPIYAAERTGSSTFVKLVNGLFKGQYNWAVDMEEAKAFRQKVASKYGFKSWDMEKTYKFTSSSGIEFELNLDHIMALYAYAKREQAHGHLLKGGFVFGKNTEVVVTKNGIKRTYLNKSAKAHNISDEIMGEIVSKLSAEQKGFVDEMQDYLSTTMGEKGNEVSLKLYGVKLFMEKFYFPLRSAGQFKEKAKEAEQKQQQGQISIANSGFTKSITPKADNPVVLDGFTDVWASHVNEMSLYHSMVLPMEDFRRVYNYASPNMEGQESASVNSFIENAYGDAATGYFDQLYNELNGGAIVDPRENLAKKRIGKFKKSAVMLSNSVWVQQFSAIGRAYALIHPKHFIGPKIDKKKHAAVWNELKQYAPVAIIKEMGGFDTHTGLSAKDYLLAEKYGKGEKIKGFINDKQYRDEIMGLLPAKADELTWCAIWEAVKRETKAKNPKLDVRSEEFLKKAGERFSEVIEKTQVYDSVLARSANMRSKQGLMQMLTSFMAEPTTTVNMIEDALRKGNKKVIARTFGAVAASILLNNALASVIYAMRDDDEDETFLEKYFQALTSGMLDDINPMTYYPILKDIWSLFQGYDVERTDMAIYSDIADAVKKTATLIAKYDSEMDEDEAAEYYKKVADALMSLLDAGASAFGIPWKNVRRDLVSYYNTYNTFARGGKNTWKSFVDAVGGSALDSIPVVGLVAGKSTTDKLYDAIISGDTTYVNRLKGSYKDQNAINNAIRKGLRENDPRVRAAAIAWNANDLDEYMRIAKEIIAEKHFVQDDVVMAIRSEASSLEPDDGATSASKAKGLFTAEKFAEAIAQGDQAMANAIKSDIIRTEQKNGKTEEEAEKSFVSSAKTKLKDLFLAGDISEQKAINAIVTYCDKTEDEALADVQYWAFKQEYPDVYADDAWFDTYYEKVADSGIDIDVYMEYRNTVSTITGEGKKEKRMAVIDSLPITNAQKDALYFAEGWTESKLYEAPWH